MENTDREWLDTCINWLESIGIPRDQVSEDVHAEDKLAFYSQATTGLMFEFRMANKSFGALPVEVIMTLDNTRHSGKSMEIFDEA